MAKKLYRMKDMPWLVIEMEEIIKSDINKPPTEFPPFDMTSYVERWKNIKSDYPINVIKQIRHGS